MIKDAVLPRRQTVTNRVRFVSWLLKEVQMERGGLAVMVEKMILKEQSLCLFPLSHSGGCSLFIKPPVDGAEILSMLQGKLCRTCTRLDVCDCEL